MPKRFYLVKMNKQGLGGVQLRVLFGLSGALEGHVVERGLDHEDRGMRRTGSGDQLKCDECL